MNLLFLLTTALSVSVDSFLCGLSLPSQFKKSAKTLLIVCLPIFLVCLIGGLGGKTLGALLKSYANLIGGIILIIVATVNFFSADKTVKTPLLNSSLASTNLKNLVAVGLAVGLDGAVACFSLVALGFNALLVITLITFTHAITLYIAVYSVTLSVIKRINFIKTVSPLTLAILGIMKIFSIV